MWCNVNSGSMNTHRQTDSLVPELDDEGGGLGLRGEGRGQLGVDPVVREDGQ